MLYYFINQKLLNITSDTDLANDLTTKWFKQAHHFTKEKY